MYETSGSTARAALSIHIARKALYSRNEEEEKRRSKKGDRITIFLEGTLEEFV